VEADIALVAFLAAAFFVGIVRGAVRQLVALGAWFVTFVVAAYLRNPVGDWIAAQQLQLSPDYVHMLGFVLSFLVLFGLAVLVIEVGGTTLQLTRQPLVDDVVGGIVGLGVGLLVVASLVIALDTFYATGPPAGTAELDFVHAIEVALQRSTIVQSLHTSLVPGLVSLLGPLLPTDVRRLVG
jgi:membrane protein required for colicin V production